MQDVTKMSLFLCETQSLACKIYDTSTNKSEHERLRECVCKSAPQDKMLTVSAALQTHVPGFSRYNHTLSYFIILYFIHNLSYFIMFYHIFHNLS